MRLKVENLGRIERAELEIAPLTVFFGPNGTNKTWTTWSAFAALEAFSTGPTARFFLPEGRLPLVDRTGGRFQPLADALDSPGETASVEVHVRLDEVLEPRDSENSIQAGGGRLAGVLRATPELVSAAVATLFYRREELFTAYDEMTARFAPATGELEVELVSVFREKPQRTRRKYVRKDWTRESIISAATWLANQVFGTVACFPAERSGLLSAFEFGSEGNLATALPEPAADYLALLGHARRLPPRSGEVTTFTSGLVRKLLGGSVDFTGGTADQRLVFSTADGTRIPISVASSLSKSIAGFALYLQRVAAPGDVLLIDELELNAHPEAQLALVELMAVLVNNGIRVLFTTHSPYIVDHLNNLLVAGRLSEKKHAAAEHLLSLGTREAFLRKAQVAAHRFIEDGPKVRVENAMDEASGQIVGATFGPATDRVMNLYGELRDLEDDVPRAQ